MAGVCIWPQTRPRHTELASAFQYRKTGRPSRSRAVEGAQQQKKKKKTKTTRRRAGHPQLKVAWESSANATTNASSETHVRNKTTPDIATNRRKRRAVGGDRWNKFSARAFEKQRRKMSEKREIRPRKERRPRDKNDVRDKRKMPERRERRPREEEDVREKRKTSDRQERRL